MFLYAPGLGFHKASPTATSYFQKRRELQWWELMWGGRCSLTRIMTRTSSFYILHLNTFGLKMLVTLQAPNFIILWWSVWYAISLAKKNCFFSRKVRGGSTNQDITYNCTLSQRCLGSMRNSYRCYLIFLISITGLIVWMPVTPQSKK